METDPDFNSKKRKITTTTTTTTTDLRPYELTKEQLKELGTRSEMFYSSS